jgi:maltose O-acetyltransferase
VEAAARYPWARRLSHEAGSLRGSVNPRAAFWCWCAGLLPLYSLAGLRAQLYRLAGCGITRSVAVQGSLLFLSKGPVAGRLHVAEGTTIAPYVTFGLDADVTIGRRVSIGPGATLCTATHAIGYGSRRMRLPTLARPIVVEDGAWIGMYSLIMPGVTLGRGCVVAAGAVVTEDVPPDSLVAGNPATVTASLPFGNR